MRIPRTHTARCPACGETSGIKITDSWALWLADTEWRCGNCGHVLNSRTIAAEHVSRLPADAAPTVEDSAND